MIKKISSKSDEGALKNMTPKNTNFRVLTDFSAPYALAPYHSTLISSGIVSGMLMEKYHA